MPAPGMSPAHRSGYVALVGRPNVGKSTLLNVILGEKVAAVSPKPQTTRNRIVGIKTTPDWQVVFLDTPGLHRPHCELNRYMVRVAQKAMSDVDLIHFVVDLDPRRPAEVDPADAAIARELRGARQPVFLVLNKVDLFRNKKDLLPRIEGHRTLLDFAEVFPISALQAAGVDELVRATVALLPEAPPYYPADLYTDQAERFLASELVREQIFLQTREELPYCAAVTVEAWTEKEGRIEIEMTIHLERDSQKGILIGRGGQRLKQIGTAARLELERILGTRVYLSLFVRVEPNWRKNPQALRKLGYEGP
jgi:GTP-binding protein Era